jgi:hypothetical protein
MTVTHSEQRDIVHDEVWYTDERILIGLWLVLDHACSATEVIFTHN